MDEAGVDAADAPGKMRYWFERKLTGMRLFRFA
jgi:hypothetical protein